MALQTSVSRNVDPQQVAVVAVGAMHAGNVGNVIPDEARPELTVRTLDRARRLQLEQRIRAIAQARADCYGVCAEVEWKPGYPVLVNTPEETAFARAGEPERAGHHRQRGLRLYARAGAGLLPVHLQRDCRSCRLRFEMIALGAVADSPNQYPRTHSTRSPA
jgi:metal-dependent amidase/aminoacylase/carboxypeptidase family protein